MRRSFLQKPFVPALLWIGLQSLLTAGIVVWKVGGRTAWKHIRESHVSIEQQSIFCSRQGPMASQTTWHGADFYFVMKTSATLPEFRVHMDSGYHEFVDQNGQLLNPQPPSRPKMPSEFTDKDYESQHLTIMSCDLYRVPLSCGEITYQSRWVLPNGRFQPFSVVVRPAWFSNTSRDVHLRSVRWLPASEKDVEGVEIVLQLSESARHLRIADNTWGDSVEWKEGEFGETMPMSASSPELLYNWSSRFQSNDGSYDSQLALADKGQAALSKRPVNSQFSPFSYIDSTSRNFKPSVVSQSPGRIGNTVILVYHFLGLRSEPRAQQFVTDIGITGNGFLHVKVPVPAQAR